MATAPETHVPSVRNRIYYRIKPLLPRSVQIALRRKAAGWSRERHAGVWPVDPRAGRKPERWPGWPGKKRFAFVLTHDVETERGQERSRGLMELESRLGFRSSFNFVPRRYPVSRDLRERLVRNGFEVGVHGLYHDGKYYESRSVFRERAAAINGYLRDWEAVGFRSPSMLRNLEWILDLSIEYDASTFDTDPFEPQPVGVGTIFPFLVRGNGPGSGYVELPYTLPQDFTLFVLLSERDDGIWKRKLEWIADRGGMALLIAHPDYMRFAGKPGIDEYPVELYEGFLDHVRRNYEGQYWHALPREVSRFIRESERKSPDGSGAARSGLR